MKKAFLRMTAKAMLLTLAYQLIFPVYANALTTGPSQPEVQSFEPVGTTEMVNMFTGDFTYNLPLLDIEGYPINIAYHSGIGVEQEASWVGLGWNINPGEINRTARGLPDDFNGEKIEKEIKINDETTFRVGMGGSVSFELFGWDAKKYGINLSLGAGGYAAFNNYKGASVGMNTSATISVPFASTGINLGIGSQDGADVDLTAGLHIEQKVSNDVGAGLGVSGSTGFNSRSGMKAFSYGMNTSVVSLAGKGAMDKDKNAINEKAVMNSVPGQSFGSSVQIGLQNYVPVVSNPGVLSSFEFQTRFGGEIFYSYPNVYLSVQKTTMKYETDGTRNGYGYLYSENAPENGITDFSRDNEGYYNHSLKNLPLSSMAYDVYAISGQGTGGVFRPFRNDIGSVYDPVVKSPKKQNSSVLMEVGVGNLVEIGTDIAFFDNEANSGPWKRLPFRGGEKGSVYEKAYFKQAGELTYNNRSSNSITNNDPVYLKEDLYDLFGKEKTKVGNMPAKFGDAAIYGVSNDRTSRSNLISYLTAEEADIPEIAEYQKVRSFKKFGTTDEPSGAFYSPSQPGEKVRYTDKDDDAKSHHISEFTQTLGDGRRYVYGIPALNHVSREVTFSVNGTSDALSTGLVASTSSLESGGGVSGHKENFYSSTSTPAYAHSYLLTSVLSSDYSDILGDGPTDDDLGGWVKFNYSLWDNDYRWRIPHDGMAQHQPGFLSDKDDDKASVITGSRQQWHIRSIESKNYVAEFYVSQREDGKGAASAVLASNSSYTSAYSQNYKAPKAGGSFSYKLDSIKLYNKHDRYLNQGNATPIKTVIFKYADGANSLCKGVPNGTSGGGKLTLEKIYIKHGSSQKNLLNPYTFTYGNHDANKHKYVYANKDRWGNYKDNSLDRAVTNYEFPYVKQDGTDLDADAAPYELTEIELPSGGIITVKYESDDYSFVQDRRTMQMFKIYGVGNSAQLDGKNNLYDKPEQVNDYIYFRRVKERENQALSLADNYLEGAEYLYYSFSMDITGTGQYEYVKGYAKIESAGICSDDDNYGYVRVKKERPGNNSNAQLHPATIYGINLARYYLPHKINPGFNSGGGPINVLKGLLAAADELISISKNPVMRYIERKKVGKIVQIDKSWIRLHRPGLTKKGGGIRVKELTLSDSWAVMASGNNGEYGKKYEYTTQDGRYGTISSGVASYEPIVGGDENPFKLPVKYTAQAQVLMPSIEFFQEEPFGESFFPPAVVGYSKVRVKSIHLDHGRSSKSIEEFQFYTAKDFPIEVDFTKKDPSITKTKNLRLKTEEVKVYQGYALRFNDMHGKPMQIANYVIRTDGTKYIEEMVSSATYKYRQTVDKKLDNNVTAMYRTRGTKNTYALGTVKLGEEVDFTVDSRERYNRSYRRNIDINVNVVLFGVIPVPVPTSFFPDKEETQTFRSMVSTKIIQRYGILESVSSYDHGTTTTVENMIYDSETGDVLLTRTNNDFNDNIYNIKYPAYWAYERMGPAYTNLGYEEKADSFYIENNNDASCVGSPSFHGRLYVNKTNFFPGDELLLQYKVGNDMHKVKVWVLDDYPEINYCPPAHAYSVPYVGSGQEKHWRVSLRALRDNNGNEVWPGLNAGQVSRDVTVKVIRSGRRNNLDKTVQNITMSSDPASGGFSNILSANSSPFSNILSANVTEYTENTTPFGYSRGDSLGNIQWYGPNDYEPEILPVNITSANRKVFNRYVLGHRGNYRPVANYVNIAKRDYSLNHARYDGKYSVMTVPFWNNANSSSGERRILTVNTGNKSSWKRTNLINKYDVFGNVVEEIDATGKFVSAQYGYNRSLPVAVTSNARQRSSSYEGFEDYTMLTPKHLYSLYKGTYYYHSLFASQFNNVVANDTFRTHYGQTYYNKLRLVENGDTITNSASHTGSRSLRLNSERTFFIDFRDPNTDPSGEHGFNYNIKNFSMDASRQYMLSMWIKPVTSGNQASIANAIRGEFSGGCPDALYSTGFFYPCSIKSGNVDGWYLVTGVLDIRPTDICFMHLTLPANAYYDDIRFVPLEAHMKSFVYDPVTFKLIAELDENNFATFYEYDQEGLLIRVKKETDKGIMTVSENRRANHKN